MLDYSDLYNAMSTTSTIAKNANTYHIVGLVLGIMAAVLGYFLFVKPEKKYDSKFINWARSFLNFSTDTVEGLLKMLYMLAAVYSLVTTINWISVDFLKFLENLVLYQVLIRVAFELLMVPVRILKQTKEINKKLK